MRKVGKSRTGRIPLESERRGIIETYISGKPLLPLESELEKWKRAAREANARGDVFAVGRIIGEHLVQLFGDNLAAARRFYAELEQTAPGPQYNPMKED
jgi:hypothetical protein